MNHTQKEKKELRSKRQQAFARAEALGEEPVRPVARVCIVSVVDVLHMLSA